MTIRAGSGPFSHLLCWVDGSEEACRSAERATSLARSIDARLSFLALGMRMSQRAGFDAYARIEGLSNPMPPLISGRVSTCFEQTMAIAMRCA